MARLLAPLAGPVRSSIVELGTLVVPEYRRRCWWYHRQIADALEGLLRYVRFKGARGGYARVAISMPPQHGKTLHGSELFPALALGQDPDLRIIAASNTVTIAKKSVANTRIWVDHAAYKATFPTRFGSVEEFDASRSKPTRVLEVEDSAQFFKTIKPRDPRRGDRTPVEGHGYYLAQGMGGSITGWGYDIGIMDDLVKNAEQALSPRHHEKLWEFYTSVFDTRERGGYAGQLYIGTRWTKPDFADELLDYWQAQSMPDHPLPIKVLKLPAFAEEGLALNPADPRNDPAFVAKHGGGLDNPTQRKSSYYLGKRNALMTQTPWVWHGMWQQEPSQDGAKFFQADEWLPFDEKFDLRTFRYLDFSIDANLSEKGQSFAVIQVTGVLVVGDKLPGQEGVHYFVLEVARGHWSYGELEKEFLRLRAKWSAALPAASAAGSIWVENKALGPTLINKFEHVHPIVAVPKAKAKIVCYRIASPITAQLRVRVPRGTWGKDPTNPALPLVTDEWVGDAKTPGSWVQELGSYPSTPDDRRDALAQQIICRTPWLGIDLLASG